MGSSGPPGVGRHGGSWGWVSPLGWGVWGGGLRGPQIWGAGWGVSGLGVSTGVGVSGTPRYGAGMGVLGLGVPTEVGSVGWGS